LFFRTKYFGCLFLLSHNRTVEYRILHNRMRF
jgi:hypothetical protein